MEVMTISAQEFIRRFLLHILPYRFMKIRHYGFLGNRDKLRRLKLCKQMTGTHLRVREKLSTADLIHKITGVDENLCPACSSRRLLHAPISPNSS